jgi:VanZ family protein
VRFVSRFAPPLLLMGVIFFLSAQPDLNSGLGMWDTILRKLAHMAVFGLLWFLWWRALGYDPDRRVSVLITILYAVTDELHQTTVEGRHGSRTDVLIDSVGIALAMLAVRLRSGSFRS